MKTSGLLSVAALALVLLTGCDVDVNKPGKMPEVDVDVKPGTMPDVDVRGPEVEVKSKETEVTVPDVDVHMEKKKITVPDVDVKIPEE
jgi:hypothetical protein